ncbi:hypothetical protein A8924_0239 [Saccharopolyspora erythraea NRRL 2338]|uniref:Uncharacterized protein n=2 Tax=Saccharopolyspora erythraea TaxID=1836 RepID=A4FQT7_SACEN|nr:hypothetical protein N599_13185 [Saccharopolyspora erythraea D]PFG93014.1 hypothetical protein A8924_0239 [Saccharopolyspora erythraea NRRL 2338]CAM06412.1 hypothetical protein SACE_7254 [Saccharopolyspora erythraea NRRL 2338]
MFTTLLTVAGTVLAVGVLLLMAASSVLPDLSESSRARH